MSMPLGSTGVPRPYEIALRLAQHRTSTALHDAKNTLSMRLSHAGINGEKLLSPSDIRRAGSMARTLQSTAWRATSRIVSQARFDAAAGAVDIHMLPFVARQAAYDAISSTLPTQAETNGIISSALKTTNGWLNTIMDNLPDNITGSQLHDLLVGWFDPNEAGGISYAADRMTQNELATSFHDAQEATAEIQNVQTVIWTLAPEHEHEDECDDLDGQEFDVNDVPDLPHIGCMCYLEVGQTGEAEEVA